LHPLGIKFGLARGLLEKDGDEVLLSFRVLEDISTQSQVRNNNRRRPIDGNFLVDLTVRAAEALLQKNPLTAPRQEFVPFFAGLNRTMYSTLCRVAERAGLMRREPGKVFTDPAVWEEFSRGAADIQIKPGHSIPKLQRALYQVCRRVVREYYLKNDPDNLRYTDLISLFLFNFWNATGLLPMAQAVVILGADRTREE
jgi:hypothetical protein